MFGFVEGLRFEICGCISTLNGQIPSALSGGQQITISDDFQARLVHAPCHALDSDMKSPASRCRSSPCNANRLAQFKFFFGFKFSWVTILIVYFLPLF